MTTQAMPGHALRQFVERAGNLYSLPAVAVEVLELTARDNVDTVALRQCVERDPALTAKLLRVVNSSMFGLSREVSDLTQALSMLGVKPLKLLVLGFSLPKELFAGVEAETLSRFWQLTLVKAVAARELSQFFGIRPGDEALIAGLLQEIGVLVLIHELGDAYTGFLQRVYDDGEDLITLETATLGFDHTTLSAQLLERWNLPAAIVTAVSARLDVDPVSTTNGSESELARKLHLAQLTASILVLDRRELMPQLLTAASRYCGVTVEQLEAFMDRLQAQVTLMANLFSVPAEPREAYRDILARAHQQMAAAAWDVIPQIVESRSEAMVDQQAALRAAVDHYSRRLRESSSSESTTRCWTPAATTTRPPRPRALVQQVTTRPDSSSDPGLRGRIVQAIAWCRGRQRELSLMLVEIDDYEHLLMLYGSERTARIVEEVCHATQELCDLSCETLIVADARCAVVLPDCDRQQAVTLARTLHDALAQWLTQHEELHAPPRFCIGIASLATPTHASRPEDLIQAADRCLFAAQRAGGGVTKSIDVF